MPVSRLCRSYDSSRVSHPIKILVKEATPTWCLLSVRVPVRVTALTNIYAAIASLHRRQVSFGRIIFILFAIFWYWYTCVHDRSIRSNIEHVICLRELSLWGLTSFNTFEELHRLLYALVVIVVVVVVVVLPISFNNSYINVCITSRQLIKFRLQMNKTQTF